MDENYSILHTIAGIHPKFGGTSRVVVDLLEALSKQCSLQSTLITQSQNDQLTMFDMHQSTCCIIANANSQNSFKLGLPFRKVLKSIVKRGQTSLIHNHGLWMPVNHWACRIARNYDIPIIMQPHGMLEPWALNHSEWKKRIAMSLFQRNDLNSAKVIFATSSMEYKNIRSIGFRQPIAVISNGVKVDVIENIKNRRSGRNENLRTILFLSRIHPKKGLENLIHAWAKVLPHGWRLCIAGPDEEGYLQKLERQIRDLGINESVKYIGMVNAEQKSEVYHNADLFVLPTYSENFGIVIAEALAHGVPVITTRGAPWADLETYSCGWWIDIGVESLVNALREAIKLSDEERVAMGERGQEYVRRYDWDKIAYKTINTYRWILGENEMPDFVHLD